MPGLDYSAGRPTGAQIRGAGYEFVVRYCGTPGRTKNITATEYRDLVSAGVAVALVYENTAGDARGGYDAGVTGARLARADADAIGFPRNRPIYMAIDDVNASDYLPACMAYLDGAASVLGRDCTGVYGFRAVVAEALRQGKARWAWQCGSWSALVAGVHLYQRNNDTTTVGGIACDINDAIAPDFGQYPQEDDLLQDERNALFDVREQLCGSRVPGQYPGWPVLDGSNRSLTVVDTVRETHRELNQQLPNRVNGLTKETIAGNAANADAYGFRMQQMLAGLQAAVATLAAAVAGDALTAEQLTAAVAAAIRDNVVTVDVSVHGQPTVP